jgi:predicted RNase H-like nuclease (RuvC/YqgF family)
MSFFNTSTPEEAMGTPEEREEKLSNIISCLGLSTFGELIWIQRTMERNFQERMEESNEEEINFYEEKKLEINRMVTEHKNLISRLSNLEQEKQLYEEEVDALKTNLQDVESEKQHIEQERDGLAQELQRIGKLYKEVTGQKAKEEDLRDILSIYITLMEEVFSGRAHFKVLSILHGEKTHWNRRELAKSTGIAEVKLRTVLGELSRGNIIQYDEEAASIQLIQKIYN